MCMLKSLGEKYTDTAIYFGTHQKTDGWMERETWIDEEKCDRVIAVITLMTESRCCVCGCLLYNSFSSALCLKNCRSKCWEKKIPRVVVG